MVRLVFTEFKEEISSLYGSIKMGNYIVNTLDIIFEIRNILFFFFMEPQNSVTRKPFSDYWQNNFIDEEIV